MRREERRDDRRDGNVTVLLLVCCANDEIVCLKADATLRGTSRGTHVGVFYTLWPIFIIGLHNLVTRTEQDGIL